jgi:hypothetical protein
MKNEKKRKKDAAKCADFIAAVEGWTFGGATSRSMPSAEGSTTPTAATLCPFFPKNPMMLLLAKT